MPPILNESDFRLNVGSSSSDSDSDCGGGSDRSGDGDGDLKAKFDREAAAVPAVSTVKSSSVTPAVGVEGAASLTASERGTVSRICSMLQASIGEESSDRSHCEGNVGLTVARTSSSLSNGAVACAVVPTLGKFSAVSASYIEGPVDTTVVLATEQPAGVPPILMCHFPHH